PIPNDEPTGEPHCQRLQTLWPAWFPRIPRPSLQLVPFINLYNNLSFASHHKTCLAITRTLRPAGSTIFRSPPPPKAQKQASTRKLKDMHETDKDIQSESFISGRLQHVPKDPKAEFKRTSLAAGAVLWRGDPQAPEVALIHRPHYDDWSLPKGKVDPGES